MATTADSGFNEYCAILKKLFSNKTSVNDLKETVAHFRIIDKKMPVDQGLRDYLLCAVKNLVSDNTVSDAVRWSISFSIECANQNLCSSNTPLQLLFLLFECLSLRQCEVHFQLLEDAINTIKDSNLFQSQARIVLLRMCNDVIRRLSKSQNTSFCGRILLFLSRLFPLDERSGLNLMSHFNSTNTTPFSSQPHDNDFCLEEDDDFVDDMQMKVESSPGQYPWEELLGTLSTDMEEPTLVKKKAQLQIDSDLYIHFWSLQDCFREPNICYDSTKWPSVKASIDKLLKCLQLHKLDCQSGSSFTMSHNGNHDFFAKYLTSEKLLNLQLMDSSFRRYILVQILVLFQYLNAPVKFKPDAFNLTDEKEWINNTVQLIKEKIFPFTPPDGKEFLDVMEDILAQEVLWSDWKNESCSSFYREPTMTRQEFDESKRKRHTNALVDRQGNKIYRFTNPEMTQLWSHRVENMYMVQHPNHLFSFDKVSYFEDAILQLDPDEKVEEALIICNSEEWSWRALRLLLKDNARLSAMKDLQDTLLTFLRKILENIGKELGLLPDQLVVNPVQVEVEKNKEPVKRPKVSSPAREFTPIKRLKEETIELENGTDVTLNVTDEYLGCEDSEDVECEIFEEYDGKLTSSDMSHDHSRGRHRRTSKRSKLDHSSEEEEEDDESESDGE